jgi:hypothetical protein
MMADNIRIGMGRNYPAEQGTHLHRALLGWIFDDEMADA